MSRLRGIKPAVAIAIALAVIGSSAFVAANSARANGGDDADVDHENQSCAHIGEREGCQSSGPSTAGNHTPVPHDSDNDGNGEGHTPVTLCHWVPAHGGSYIVITVDDDGANGNVNGQGHMGHEDDIIPAPSGTCPSVSATTATPTSSAVGTNTPTASATTAAESTTPTNTSTPMNETDTPTATQTSAGASNTPTSTPTGGASGLTAATPTSNAGVLGAKVSPAAGGAVAGAQALPSAGYGFYDEGSRNTILTFILVLSGTLALCAAAMTQRRR